MAIQMRDDNPFEEYCPSCGKYTGGEGVCPNCGDEIFDEEGMDEFEEGDESNESEY